MGKYDNLVVTVDDMRSIQYCSRGAKEFAKRYNLDMRSFLDNGIPANELLALDNAMATAAVEAAAKRAGIE